MLEFYRDVFNSGTLDKVDDYIAEDYIQHNPGVPQGREGFKKAFGEAFAGGKKFNLRVLKVIAGEGMAGVLIAHGPGGDPNGALMDIYRLDADGRVCEHWDVFNDRH